ncbi:murein L,D-transpeptidase catalytic domain family protein [Sphingomonas sediminicola]|uniref:Murein L,D-transpeptidase catalytic domain family protein n=2 Tax=Sphingomonas sediminicola TaxID=386874 RepID=A0ABX6TB70_9SPHN|nr:murein L,D-transpeptidase catalytic domain family protein [Sphingomonas sediminicola]
MLSSAASSVGLPSIVYAPPPVPRDPLAPLAPVQPAPVGLNPVLFQKAKAALDSHRYQARARDLMGIVDFSKASSEARFHLVDLMNGTVESHLVAHGRGSDPDHSGFVERFSNDFGSYATSNGAYTTGDYYEGKYGLSMKVQGLDWSNSNAEARAIVIHNAWYAEPEMIAQHGKLGRSEGCFAFSRASQWDVMRRLAGGRMIYADKIA